MSSVKQFQVTFDCAEPVRVARFWAETLRYQAEYDDEQGGWAAALDHTGTGPRLYFQRVPEGKVVKNRVHLDVRVGTGLVGEERCSASAGHDGRPGSPRSDRHTFEREEAAVRSSA